eukprot:145043-Pelagomonas_calceolata.AAC.3
MAKSTGKHDDNDDDVVDDDEKIALQQLNKNSMQGTYPCSLLAELDQATHCFGAFCPRFRCNIRGKEDEQVCTFALMLGGIRVEHLQKLLP